MNKMKVVFLYLISFVMYFTVSYNTPRVGDDNMYLTKYYADVNVPAGEYGTWHSVSLAGDMLQRSFKMALWEFKNDTGRFMDFVCGWNLIPYPKIVFSLASSFVWVLFLHLIWMVSGKSEKLRMPIFMWSYFLLLQNDAALWMGGTSAYLWPVAWSLLLVPIFLSPRLTESALVKKNWWMWITLPIIGFCGGGWHEIIGVPVCFLLLIYWVRTWIRDKEFVLSGQFLLSFFFGIASLVVVFAPSSLARFDSQTSASLSYMILTKSMALANTVVLNPIVLLTIFVIGVMILQKGKRARLFERGGYWLFMLVFVAGIVCILGEGADRTSWPVSVLSLIILLRLIPFEKMPIKWSSAFSTSGIVLAALTFVYTAYGVVRTRLDHENALSAWRENSFDLCAIPENPDSLFGFLFDRSLPARSLVWFGPTSTKNMNPALAAKYNRKVLLGLPVDALAAFGDGASFCIKSRMIKVGNDTWFADPDLDVLVRPLGETEPMLTYGKELSCKVSYRKPGGLTLDKILKIFRYDVKRFSGGFAIFKLSNFFQTFARDVIYATIYANIPTKAFTVKTDTGYYIVVQNNRFNDRKQIQGIDVK